MGERLYVDEKIIRKPWKIPVGSKAYYGSHVNTPHVNTSAGFYVIEMAEDFYYSVAWTIEGMKKPHLVKKGQFLCIPRVPYLGGAGGIREFDSFSHAKEVMGHLVRKNIVDEVNKSFQNSYEEYMKRVKEADEKEELGYFDGKLVFNTGAEVKFTGTGKTTDKFKEELLGTTVQELIDSGLISKFEMERR